MEQKQKLKMKKRALPLFLVVIALCLLLPIGVTGCSSDDVEEISFWDESSPEEIVEKLVEVPAYVDTIMNIHKDYVCVFYSHDADMLDYYLGIDHSKIGMIAVKVKDIRDKGILFHSKVYVTADVTNRCQMSYDYADKVLHDTFDWGWGGAHIIPSKAFLYDIRERD